MHRANPSRSDRLCRLTALCRRDQEAVKLGLRNSDPSCHAGPHNTSTLEAVERNLFDDLKSKVDFTPREHKIDDTNEHNTESDRVTIHHRCNKSFALYKPLQVACHFQITMISTHYQPLSPLDSPTNILSPGFFNVPLALPVKGLLDQFVLPSQINLWSA
ncbi:hypothetical protein SCLCIDRAFT_203716 [Scleroderma citrinum Foug A]|uniref:Uncharacterized protein n=1 Tax=Scleroderma citrinum Foug A TaxID=1036808 RepID=A0A0C3DL05_9AGAM|nr:hypothetical protein SCLCIDRAFT_203716 [Scleroderma citrinum Foug A]